MPAHLHRPSPRAARLLVLLFLGALLAPWIDALARPADERGPVVEGRTAEEFPPWTWESLRRQNFASRFELAFTDHLGLRDVLLRWQSRLRLDVWDCSPSPVVLVGKRGWMFYTGEDSAATWRGLNRFSPEQLSLWQRVIERRRDRARSLGARYLLVYGPNKESIYPDFLPDGWEPLGPTRLDQFLEWMGAHSDVDVVDLRPVLRAARAEDTPDHHLYYEEGTHWHGRGCMAAANEILRRIALHFPAVAEVAPTNWRLETSPTAETWRTKMYLEPLPTRLRDEWRQGDDSRRARPVARDPLASVQRFEQLVQGSGLPRVVMFHDSFGPGVFKLLAERCGTFTSENCMALDDALVAAEHADLVLDLFVERALAVPNPWVFSSQPGSALVRVDTEPDPRFDLSQDVRLRCDAQTPLESFPPQGGIKLEARLLPPAPGLLLESSGAGSSLLLPELAPGPARDLVLRLAINSPVESQADLFYATEKESWSQRQSIPLALRRGKNSIEVFFAASEHVRRLRLRPGRTAGTRYLLRSLEVRALEAP